MNEPLTALPVKWMGSIPAFLFCMLSIQVQAQLCTGSLGDPVVSFTFGSGSSPGAALDPAVTNYNYIATDCPNDGQYTVRANTTNCYNSWHTLATDHTGDQQGYFMMVNASFAPSDFYVQKVSGICANTTYEFAAWVMNLVRISGQIKPDITFSIEDLAGTVLGSFSTGDIANTSSPQWRQYGFNFRTPPGTFEVILRMRNNAPGGIGNDIALDDITFRPCGPLLRTSVAGSADTVQLCQGSTDSFELAAVIPAFFSNPAYQWQVSENSGNTWLDINDANTLRLTVAPTAVGTYWYRIAVGESENFAFTKCRITSTNSVINVHASPVVYAGPDKIIIKDKDGIILDGVVSTPVAAYVWSPLAYLNEADILSPLANPPSDQIYSLSAISPFGCTATDDVFIKVISGIYVPNAFSPNGDGRNDAWRIRYLEYLPEATVKVYNRHGTLIYKTEKGEQVEWDGNYKGKPQPIGTYIYLVQMGNGDTIYKGSITLFR